MEKQQTILKNWKDLMTSKNEEDRELALNMINIKSIKNFDKEKLYEELRKQKEEISYDQLIRLKEVFRKNKFKFWIIDFV